MLVTARKLDQMEEPAALRAPGEIETAPRPLTSGDFEALADIERPELVFEFEAVDAEVVDDSQAG